MENKQTIPRVILIIGANRGIGYYMVKRLLELGNLVSVLEFHPPLTNTASSSELLVPKEFMATPQKVGKGLAEHIESKKFVICHSFSQAMQMKFCYRHPLFMGKMMWKMTTRAKNHGGQ